jgi:hypothetical protein
MVIVRTDMKTYKAEKMGRNWCITKNGQLFRTIGAYRGSWDHATEQADELNAAFTAGVVWMGQVIKNK